MRPLGGISFLTVLGYEMRRLKKVVETYINETTELTHIFVGSEEIVYSLVFKLFNSPALGLRTIRVSTLWGTF